jgi:lysozyme
MRVVGLSWLIPSYAVAFDTDDSIYSRTELFSIIRNAEPGIDLFALPSKFKFPDNARDTSSFGLDFSHYQEDSCKCEYNWGDVAKQKVRFVYVKASQGQSVKDRAFSSNVPQIASAGLDLGAYHFFTSDADADDQAKNFLAAINPVLSSMTLLPSLDLEWDPGPMRDDCPNDAVIKIRRSNTEVILRCDKWAFVTADEIIKRANKWLDAIKLIFGKEPVLYTSAAWWKPRIGKKDRIQEVHAKLIWVADYSTGGLATETPGVPTGAAWSLWQFTDGASINVSGKPVQLDASIFNGAFAAFKIQFGK